MHSRRPKILICGKSLVTDDFLLAALQKKYDLVKVENYLKLEDAVINDINLTIFESSNKKQKDLQILKYLKKKSSTIILIAIVDDGSVENTAEIFFAGASDVFPKPFDPSLLLQRVEGLLKKLSFQSEN